MGDGRRRDSATERNVDVGSMLQGWRHRRPRSEIPGLEAALPRRRYLTQLDMALLLGVSERLYWSLENGVVRPYPRTMIDGVARILNLTPVEAEALYIHAGHPIPRRPATRPDPLLVDMVERQTGCISYLSDEAWDVLACNPLGGLHAPWLTKPNANIVTWAFSPDASFQLREFDKCWALPILAEVRATWQRCPDNARLAEVVAEVRARPGVNALWERTARTEPYLGERPMFFPLLSPDPVDVHMLALNPFGDQYLRWIIMVPTTPGIELI